MTKSELVAARRELSALDIRLDQYWAKLAEAKLPCNESMSLADALTSVSRDIGEGQEFSDEIRPYVAAAVFVVAQELMARASRADVLELESEGKI